MRTVCQCTTRLRGRSFPQAVKLLSLILILQFKAIIEPFGVQAWLWAVLKGYFSEALQVLLALTSKSAFAKCFNERISLQTTCSWPF